MKHRNRIATIAAAGLVIAGAAMESPATAGGYFGLSIAAPGYYGAPVVVHSNAAGAYTAPYYAQPAYEDSDYGVPSYEGEQYYSAGSSYHGRSFVPLVSSRTTGRISGMKNAAAGLRAGMTMAATANTDNTRRG